MATTTTPNFWQKLAEWNASAPKIETEESIPLRVLVQILVFIAIGATDQTAEKSYSLWAIPLSAMAAGWGWYSRKQRNIPVKIFIALGMVAALFSFLGDLVNANDETRILLSRLLIQLQVLHSFDLPRRKDLGYSMVIGFILMGVSATLSQTMVFGGWIVAFVAVIIPVLVLDLRSRLGVTNNSWQFRKLGVAPSSIVTLLGLVMIVGLMVFFLLPRFQGYQVRTFPVSTDIVTRQAPPGRIIQPNKPNNPNAPGANNSEGGGNNGNGGILEVGRGVGTVVGLPPLFAEEFDATRSVRLEPELVMRVRSQAELFWRVLAYDRYTGKGWKISRSREEDIKTIERNPLNYKFELPFNLASLVIPARSRQVIQTYTITTDFFPNLIPAAATPAEIYFPSDEIEYDPEGNLRAPGILPIDTTYTVVSNVAMRDQEKLQKVKVYYPKSIGDFYLAVPPQLLAEIKPLTEDLIRNATNIVNGEPLNIDNAYDAALFLAQHLKQTYRLPTPESPPLPTDRDIVAQFLDQKEGTPTQFVSTFVLMMRSLGVPARYSVGFAPGRFNPFTGYYEVMNTDAMSLGEVFFPGYGWLAFNPVPGMPLLPPSIEEDQTFNALRSFWRWVAGFLPSPIAGFFGVVFSQIGKFLASLVGWLISLGWIGLFLGVLIIVLVALALWGLWQFLLWWLDRLQLARLHPIERSYQEMIRETGINKPPHSTPQEYARLLAESLPHSLMEVVWQITSTYQDWRYGNLVSRPPRELQLLLKQLRGKGWRKISYTQTKL